MKPQIETLLALIYLTNYNLKIIHNTYINCETNEQMLGLILSNFSEIEIRNARKRTKESVLKMEEMNVKVIPFHSSNYPKSILITVKDYPLLLFVRGQLLEKKMIAVVGSRKTTRFAQKITNNIVDWIGELNLGVVSGLALGVDSYAHRQSVKRGLYNVAILPCAIDRVYPKSNIKLADEILKTGGALISEFAIGITMHKGSFTQRNRLQVGMSSFVLPVEMKKLSGTMVTINFAKNYQKPIFVLRPTLMLRQEGGYEGIINLIDNDFPNLTIFKDEEDFKSKVLRVLD